MANVDVAARASRVHLVGSVPLDSSEAVFRSVAAALGPFVARIPDGETGVRKNWIAWQYEVLARTPGLEPVPVGDRGYLRRQLVRLTGDRREPRFGALGYADAALASYPIFERLQREGVIPAHCRFQVSLPTPLAPMTVFVSLDDRGLVEPAYERQLLAELARITDAIPHEKLALQWDVAAEFGLLERIWPAHFPEVERGVVTRLARVGGAVPRDVALGFHLCYGDFGHKHFVEPQDAQRLVALANALFAALGRAPAWVHMPVPIGWTEPRSYAPLRELALPASTALYLGLVHDQDGTDGARRRIALASEVRPRFGIATECGWGRRPPESIPALLQLHAEVAALLPQSR